MDIVEQLKRQADECSKASPSRNGWGNTMRVAANEIEQLRHIVAENSTVKSKELLTPTKP
jgi:hypothetical protein